MINIHVINKVEVEPLHTSSFKKKNLLGKEYFEIHPYLCFIASKKKSGKTSLIHTIIKNTTDKNTKLFLFVSTHNVDKSWIEIKKFLTKRGNIFEAFDSIKDNKVDNLEIIMEALNAQNEEEEEKEELDLGIKLLFDKPPVKRKPKKKKKKRTLITPEYLFVFDDISQELKLPSIARFMKQHRHWGASGIISSQYPKDLQPQSVSQIDYFLTFKNFSTDKLEHMHRLIDLSINFNDFLDMYHYATKEPYQFLYVNTRDEQIRKNFNTLLEIKHKKDNDDE